MQAVNIFYVDKKKINALAKAMASAQFEVSGVGWFSLSYEEHKEFLAALLSCRPNVSLRALYARLCKKYMS